MWRFKGSSLRLLCSTPLICKTIGGSLEKTCHRLVFPTRLFSSHDPHSSSSVDKSKSSKSHVNDIPTPQGSWQDNHKSRNQRWALMLGIGVTAFWLTLIAMKKAGVLFFHGAPPMVNKDDSKADKKQFSLFSKEKKIRTFVELPNDVQYLIIGAGTAAYSAYRAIRSADSTAKVLLIGQEDTLPYMRPPLSKELWYSDDKELVKQLQFKQWNGRERSLFYEKEGFYCKPKELEDKEFGGVAVALGLKAVRLDVKSQKVYFDDGRSVGYGKCLIATGGKPKNLPLIEIAGNDVSQRTILFRTVDDFKNLDKLTQSARSVVIIGGGFMGSELACALGKRASENKKLKVTQLFPENGNMGLVLPEYLSKWATEKVRKEGVDVLTEASITGCRYDAATRKVVLTVNDGKTVTADQIIVAVGLEPNTDLAASSGLEVHDRLGGFLVNAELEARSNVWVAGDAACFYDVKLGRRRVEHHDHAVVSGRLAGENMTGPGRPYWHQSMFWSDLGPEVGYEAIGIVDSSLPTVSVFAHATDKDTPKAVVEATGESLRSETEQVAQPSAPQIALEPSKGTKDEEFGKGVIFYLRDDIVVGIVMWNVFNKMPIARQIISEAAKYDDLTEVAKLFNLYGEPEEKKPEEKKEEEGLKSVEDKK